MEQVMVKTFKGQAIIRFVDGEEDGKARIVRDAGSNVWLADKGQVYVLDRPLFEAMKAYDELLDMEPEALRDLWGAAVPYFPMG